MPDNKQDKPAFGLSGSLSMTLGGAAFGGHGRMALLASIGERGSITQAAKAVGISYKAAWDGIDAMNNLAGEPLVERLTGGKGGGGTRLTARGAQLVDNYRRLHAAHQRFIEQLALQAESMADDYVLIRRMGMKTSARNQFLGKVAAVTAGAVNDEITLETASGLRLTAIVTHDSAESLGLTPGAEVFALIKSSSIILALPEGGARFSARNQLAGAVSRIVPGAVNTEVVLDLDGGGAVAAIVTNESCAALGLGLGARVIALFKASSVILGVPA